MYLLVLLISVLGICFAYGVLPFWCLFLLGIIFYIVVSFWRQQYVIQYSYFLGKRKDSRWVYFLAVIIVMTVAFVLSFIRAEDSKSLCNSGSSNEYIVISAHEKGVLIQELRFFTIPECGQIKFISCRSDCPSIYSKITVTPGEVVEFNPSSSFGFVKEWKATKEVDLSLGIILLLQEGNKIKQQLFRQFQEVLSLEQSQLYISILFGGIGLAYSLKESMKEAGVLHLSAVSGANISLVAEIITLFTQKKRRGFRIIGEAISIAVFMLFVGFSPPTIRAVLAFIVNKLAQVLGITIPAKENLFIVCIIEFLLFPTLIFSISFYLTVTALYVIVILFPYGKRVIGTYLKTGKSKKRYVKEATISKVGKNLLGIMLLGILIKVHTGIIIAIVFHEVSITNQWKSFFVEPLIEVISLYGYFIVFPLLLFPYLGVFLLTIPKVLLTIVTLILDI